MITGWPRCGRMPSAMMRPIVSVEPPGASGTRIVTGREGKDCAFAEPIKATAPSAMAIIVFIISFLPVVGYRVASRLRPGLGPHTHANPPGLGLTTEIFDSRPLDPRADERSGATRSIETRASWVVAGVSLLLLGLSFGGPWITAVGLKQIAADTGGARSVPSLAVSLSFVGMAVGGLLMGRIANSYGVRVTVITGSVMIALGLVLSAGGAP